MLTTAAARWQLDISADVQQHLQTLDEGFRSQGLSPHAECLEVASFALRFHGREYLRTEELSANSIDCSTLTSQSLWCGAAVGIPFVADNQRSARSAVEVPATEVLPGDVAVRYRSLEESPEPYNHVALVIGRVAAGSSILMLEAAGGIGVRFTTDKEFCPAAGYRRFLPNPLSVFDTPNSQAALLLAQRVPKLGRFGARQYRLDQSERPSHLGADIYVPSGTPVYAPVSGEVREGTLPHEDAPACWLRASGSFPATVVLGCIEPVVSGGVERGELVGHVKATSPASQIEYVGDSPEESAHVHFAVLLPFQLMQPAIVDAEGYWQNPLYACKLGLVDPPLRDPSEL